MSALGYFTPAKEDELLWMPRQPSKPASSCAISGEEAQRFYLSLVEERNEEKKKRGGEERRDDRERQGELQQQRRRENHRGRGRGRGEGGGERVQANRPVVNTPTELDGFKLLRCAQEGDLPGMRVLLDRGVDINFQDNFFWTALMCACWEGQRAPVRLLLRRGAAWVGVVDTQGRDARELAQRAGHRGVIEELEGHGRPTQDRDRSSAPAQSQWCAVCGSHYSDSQESHLSSTLHQFSLRRPAPPTHYCLPPSSAGYQMMLRSGWNPEGGLGPEGGGPRQPVRTVLKRDQRGLGYGPPKHARVTHFQPKDPQAVKQPPKEREGAREMREGGMRKEESRRKEARDRTWERDFRNSFYH